MARKPAQKKPAASNSATTTKRAAPRKRTAKSTPLEDTIELPHARGSILSDFTKNGPLLPAEEKLREACMRGEVCFIDAKRPDAATKDNTIRASFLRYVILGGCKNTPLHARGVRLESAYIMCPDTYEFGKCVDLESLEINHDVVLGHCNIDGSICIRGSKTKSVNLGGSRIGKLFADRLEANGSIFLREQFSAKGEVCLLGAKIDGDLDCNNSSFESEETAILCDGLEITGSIILAERTNVFGEVRLVGAKIGGDLDCCNSSFIAKQTVLCLDRANITGSVFLTEKFHAGGDISMRSTRVGSQLALKDSKINGSLELQNACFSGNVLLDYGFNIDGKVDLSNARIGGNLHCDSSTFTNKDNCLIAKRTVIEGDCDLGSMKANGTINLNGAKIGGDFTPQGATLLGSPSLQMRGTEIGGTLIWRELFANGEVDLGGASCRTINMGKEHWLRKREDYETRRPQKETVQNGKQPSQPEDKQQLAPTENSEQGKPPAHTQNFTRLDNFTFQGFSNLPTGCNAEFWIEFLDQQSEDHLKAKFRPRPWEQLAGVLHSMGYEAEAKSVRIEKERRLTSFMADYEPASLGEINWKEIFSRQFWSNARQRTYQSLNVFWRRRISEPLVDYGYRPGKAILYLAAMVLLGTVIYYKATLAGLMTPTHPLIFKEASAKGSIPIECAENWVYFPKGYDCEDAMPSEYSEFQSFIYAADVALPIVNLRMENDWAPRVVNTDGSRNMLGWWVRTFEWFLIASGWLLSLLFASAVGGIIRR